MTEQAKVRRLQDTLSIAGVGVIAFSVWSFAKIGLFLALVDEKVLSQLLGFDAATLSGAVLAGLAVILIIDVCFRAYVGLSARAVGRGEKRGAFYLVVAALAAIGNASSLVGIAFGTSFALPPLAMGVSIAIEATAIAALVLVIFISVRLRRIGKTAE